MCRETTTRITGAALDAMDRDLVRLSRELSCLIELDVLGQDEVDALTGYLGELQELLVRARSLDAAGVPPPFRSAADLPEMSGRVRALGADIDLAYQRLSFAA